MADANRWSIIASRREKGKRPAAEAANPVPFNAGIECPAQNACSTSFMVYIHAEML
jgi:hypothetical protein